MLFVACQSRLSENHTLGRIVEFHAQTPKFVDDAKIDGLLQIEQRIEVGLLHEVRQLEMQRGVAEVFQVAALEPRIRLFAHDTLEQRGYSPQLVLNTLSHTCFLSLAMLPVRTAFSSVGLAFSHSMIAT